MAGARRPQAPEGQARRRQIGSARPKRSLHLQISWKAAASSSPPSLGHDIGFGIGIAHGFATLGTIGFEGRFDYARLSCAPD